MINEKDKVESAKELTILMHKWVEADRCPNACLYVTLVSGFLGTLVSLESGALSGYEMALLVKEARKAAGKTHEELKEILRGME